MEKRKEIHVKKLKDKEAGQRSLKTMKWADCKMSVEEKNSAREVGGVWWWGGGINIKWQHWGWTVGAG